MCLYYQTDLEIVALVTLHSVTVLQCPSQIKNRSTNGTVVPSDRRVTESRVHLWKGGGTEREGGREALPVWGWTESVPVCAVREFRGRMVTSACRL